MRLCQRSCRLCLCSDRTYAGAARSGLRPGVGQWAPVLEPVLSYRVVLPEGCEPRVMLPKIREFEEEEPALRVVWDEELQEIQMQIMGEVQIEILQRLIADRFGVLVSFDEGRILYKETIAHPVEGVGHFEPLGHYAEVHLLLEPQPRGSGLTFAVNCSEDSFQELAAAGHDASGGKDSQGGFDWLAHYRYENHLSGGAGAPGPHPGWRFPGRYLPGSAPRLERSRFNSAGTYYAFRLEVPDKLVGRAIADMEVLQGTWEIVGTDGELTVLSGRAPVATMPATTPGKCQRTPGVREAVHQPCGILSMPQSSRSSQQHWLRF